MPCPFSWKEKPQAKCLPHSPALLNCTMSPQNKFQRRAAFPFSLHPHPMFPCLSDQTNSDQKEIFKKKKILEWKFSFLFFFFAILQVMWDLIVPWPGIELLPPAVEAQSLNHWTAREVPRMGILTRLIHLSFKMCLLIDFPAHILSAFLQSIETDTQISQLGDHLCVLWWSCDHVVEAGRWGGTAMRVFICLLWEQGGQSVTLPWKRACWSPHQQHRVREARCDKVLSSPTSHGHKGRLPLVWASSLLPPPCVGGLHSPGGWLDCSKVI